LGVSILEGKIEGRMGAVFVSRTTGTCFGPLMSDYASAQAFSEYLGEDPRRIPEDKLVWLYGEWTRLVESASDEQRGPDGDGEIRFVSLPHQSGGEPTGAWLVYDNRDLEIVCENLPSDEKAQGIATVINADADRLDDYYGLRWSEGYQELR